jgi:TolB protein
MRKRRRSSQRQFRLAFIAVLLMSVMLSVVPTIYGQDETPTPTPAETPFAPTEAPTSTPVPTEELTETPPPTEEATPAPTEEATPAPTEEVTPVPTEEPTETTAPTEEVTPEPTPEVTPELTPEMTPEATPESTPEPQPVIEIESPASAMSSQGDPITASCAMQINNAGDADALSWQLVADASGVTGYEWFVNGVSVSTDTTYVHTFPGVGAYTIRLRCTTASLGDLNVEGYVNIASIPDANFDLSPTGGTAPLTVYTINRSRGDGLSYAWSVTDSSSAVLYTSSDFNFNYAFTTPGTYTITLTVSNSSGSDTMAADVVVIDAPPNADFTLSQNAGAAPLTVTVNGVPAAGSGPISTWSWSVSPSSGVTLSGSSGPGPHTVTFADDNPTPFTIRLDYTGPGGGGWAEKQVVVMEDGASIRAEIAQVSSSNGSGNEVIVCFENRSTGPIATNEWDFDNDGTYDLIDNSPVVCRAFEAGRSHIVKLLAKDSSGDVTSEADIEFVAQQAPVAYFTSTSPIQTGDSVTFDGSDSVNRGGEITNYTWTIGGVQVATGPSTSSFTATNAGNAGSALQYGPNLVRLTVSGPGGTSYVESIVTVERRALTCDFSGNLSVPAGSGAQTYTSNVGGAGGRTVSYTWTVQGNGRNDSSTNQNLSYTFPAGEGTYTVTLRGSTADGSSCTVSKTVTVTYPALTCNAITGNGSPLPNGTSYTYTASAGNIGGRSLTYVWFVNGAEVQRGASNTLNRSWTTDNTTDSLQVQIIPSAGVPCSSAVRTVTAAWPALTCNITGNNRPLPNNTAYTYTATPSNLAGRTGLTYEWSIGGMVVQSGPTPTLARQYAITGQTETIDLRVIPQAGQGLPCNTSFSLEAVYSDLTCEINGTTTPRPNMPSDPDGINENTYSTTVTGADGRPLTYIWSEDVPGSVGGATSFTRNWDWTEINTNETYGLQVIATNYDGTTEDCTDSLNVTVTMPALTCAAPMGDTRPVIGERVDFTYSVGNDFGRPRTSTLWELQRWDATANAGAGGWVPVETSTNTDYGFVFSLPNARYQVRYTVVYETPRQNCESGWTEITMPPAGSDFTCDAWVSGSTTPNTGSNYTYRVNVDNTNRLNLTYTWVLVDSNLNETVVATQTSTIDGDVTSPNISGAALGPVGSKTLRVDVTSSASSHTCSLTRALTVGTWAVNFTRSVPGPNIAIGQQVCLDNTSGTSYDGLNGLTYEWDFTTANNSLNTQTSTAAEPGCISFNAEGAYTITLRGTNAYDESRQQQVTYNVWREQSILISRTDSNQFAGQTFGFRATGVNINSYAWNIYNPSGALVGAGNSAGATASRMFSTAGQYRVTVRGTGPLGNTNAEMFVNVLGADDVRAAFRPSQYAGVAPMRVCFTDGSQSSSQINEWQWDLDGDGTYELVYNRSNIPAEICRDYTTPGQRVPVRLRVTNSNGRSANATNIIRTYTAQEAASNFAIQPQGGARYCFDPVISGGTVVEGWDFGDGSTPSTVAGRVCHTFPGAGSYLVTMKINGGEVVREVVVDPESAPPVLSMTASCAADRTASFVISNTGTAMTTPDTLTIRDVNGNVVAIRTVKVGAGQSITVNVADMSGPVTGGLTDSNTVSANTDCNYRPSVSVVGECVNTVDFRFTVSNAAGATVGAMHAPQDYTITNSAGTTVNSGSFNLGTGAEQVINLTNVDPYETYTFSSNGYAGTFSVGRNCGSRPVLEITSVCANPGSFTIRNTGGAMLLSQPIIVRDASANPVTVSPTSFQLGAGGSLTINLPAGSNPYTAYTLSTSGFAGGATTHTRNCADPVITVTATCADPKVFTIRNAAGAGAMLLEQSYTISNIGGTQVASGTFNLAAGATQTITLTGVDPYDTYNFATDGFAVVINQSYNCFRPVIEITSLCANPAQFTIRNTGGAMLSSQPITVLNASGNAVTASASSFQLGQNGSLTVTLPGANPYAAYTLSTTGFAGGQTSHTHNCADPDITASATCANPKVFTISNGGNAGAMLVGQNYTITNSDGDTVASGTFNLNAGSSLSIPLTGLDPYDTYTLSSSGFAVNLNYNHNCARPVIELTSTCADPAQFTIRNTGGAMLVSQPITVVNASGNAVTASASSFTLGAGGSLTVTLPGVDPYAAYTLSTSGFAAGETSHIHNCADPSLSVDAVCAYPVVFTISNATGAGDMLSAEAFTITNSAGDTVASGTFQLDAGESLDIPLTGLDPYDTYTFNSDDFAGTLNFSHDCARPTLALDGLCVSPVEFTIINNGGDMLTPQTVSVVDANGDPVTPSMSSFQLDAGEEITISLPNVDPYQEYTLTTSGFAAGETQHTQNCADPGLAIDSLCAIPVTFTVTNNGREMLQPQAYTIVNSAGETVLSGEFTLGAGESEVIELTDLDPYDTYTFNSDDYAGTLNLVHDCERPVLTVNASCEPAAFTVMNTGGDMTGEHPFTVVDGTGNVVRTRPETVQLMGGESITIYLPGGADPYGARIFFEEYGVEAELQNECPRPPVESTSVTMQPTVVPGNGIDGVWADQPVCGHNCPDFRLYHTNETGDWEIFRLDGADAETRTSDRRNISESRGEGVKDMAPSLSPNTRYVVFTSNRATQPGQPENWELYVAPSEGGDPDAVIRMTYNMDGNDTDPVWGPNNWVVFETNRNGNWDLYAIDLWTAEEYQLTTHQADDINPSWSPDGQKIAFQSMREGRWMIYEFDMNTGEVTRLSDGTTIDVEPAYSFGGEMIAFRSYTEDDARSVIETMRADGSDRRALTRPEEDATNHTWSPFDNLIAYQSDEDGDLDVYVYDLLGSTSRKVTDNPINDYAPTWRCDGTTLVFTSDINGNPDIYEESATPIADPPVRVEDHSVQMTFDPHEDVYPVMTPAEENASREGQTPAGEYGEQTTWLEPDVSLRPINLAIGGLVRDGWTPIWACGEEVARKPNLIAPPPAEEPPAEETP